MRETAGHSEVSVGSVVDWTLQVARLVVERQQKQYVKWPGPEEQRDISTAREMEKALRYVVGRHTLLVVGLAVG